MLKISFLPLNSPKWGISSLKFVFSEENVPTRTKYSEAKVGGGNCSPATTTVSEGF